MDELVRTLSRTGADAASPSVMISAIGGMGGVGKTALAVKAGQQVSDRYPDGQLLVDLGGGDTAPVGVLDALAAVLRAVGVPPTGEPENLQLATARYRTALAGRRLLLVLDDAASVDQVTPLIPGTAGSAVVITSRHQLAAIPGVHYLGLQVMSEDEAVQLLAEVAGQERVSAEPDAAREVVRRCGYLPLAIRIAGAHPSGQLAGGLAILAELLTNDRTMLDTLNVDAGLGVRASIALSLRTLGEDARPGDSACAEAFPWLALFEGDHFPLRVAAEVLELPLDETENLLERLVDVHLLETPALHQYRMHDLVRAVGRELAGVQLTDLERAAAGRRELGCYHSVLWRVCELGNRQPAYATGWSAGAEDIVELEQGKGWLEAEIGNLLRVIRRAAQGDREDRLTAARMGLGMHGFAVVRMRFAEPRDAVLAVVGILDEPDNDLDHYLWTALGQLQSALDQRQQALECARTALPLVRKRGDVELLVICLIELAYAGVRAGQAKDAIDAAQEALELVPQLKDAHLEATAWLVAGAAAGAVGDLAGQSDAFERVVAIHPEPGPGVVPMMIQVQMGESLVASGRYEQGLAMLTDVLGRLRRVGSPLIELDVLVDIGQCLLEQGDERQALEYFELALPIAVRFPAERREAGVRHHFGRAALAAGRSAEARSHWEQAVLLYNRAADPAAAEVQLLLDAL